MTEGYSLSDIAAATGGNRNNGGFGDGDWGAWIILFLLFGLFGGRGFGGFGGGGNGLYSGGNCGCATPADITSGFAVNNLQSGIDAIQHGICDSTYALNNTITNGFFGVERGISGLSSELADCCCKTQRAIDGVNYNLATHVCDLKNTMNFNTRDILENNNTNTRAILDFLTQDKIATLTAENQDLKRAASQDRQNALLTTTMTAQTQQVLNAINPPVTPAYIVPNPNCCYGNYSVQNNCGCGCGSFN